MSSVNEASTEVAAFIVTTHGPVPVQAPDHPVNSELAEGVGVSVTIVPMVKSAVQVLPQLMPVAVTVPVPVPDLVTVRRLAANVAVTVFAASIVVTQVPVPEQPPPDQPANVEVGPGVAVSVTRVPDRYSSEQSRPHVMPIGFDVTVPVPVPVSSSESVNGSRRHVELQPSPLVRLPSSHCSLAAGFMIPSLHCGSVQS